jgi:hypothetical protein
MEWSEQLMGQSEQWSIVVSDETVRAMDWMRRAMDGTERASDGTEQAMEQSE